MKEETSDELQQLLNSFKHNVSALERICDQGDLFHVLIANLAIFRLDRHTRELFEQKTGKTIPLWPKLCEFLEEQQQILSSMPSLKTSAKPNPSSGHNPSSKNQDKRTTSTHVTNVTEKKVPSCKMCPEPHRIGYCPLFIALDAAQRASKASELKLCANCLGAHPGVNCPSKYSCRECKQKHHTLLHPSSQPLSQSDRRSYPVRPGTSFTPGVQQHYSCPPANAPALTFTGCNSSRAVGYNPVLLSTAIIEVRATNGEWHQLRALLDNGSHTDYLRFDAAEALQLPLRPTHVQAKGLGQKTTVINRETTMTFRGRNQTSSYTLDVLVTGNITGQLPQSQIDARHIQFPKGIVLADPTFDVPGRIDVLIGIKLFNHIVNGQTILYPDGPCFKESSFGWIVSGEIAQPAIQSPSHDPFCHLVTLTDLTHTMEKFYKHEDYRCNKKFLTEEEEYCERFFEQTHQRSPSGRFIVTLPLKANADQLVNNHKRVLNQFLSNEKRLQRNDRLRAESEKFMREYEQLGHMTQIDTRYEAHDTLAFYLPHHDVEKPDSTTTKVRKVFNGSSPTASGLSFNDVQCVGPQIQSDSFSLLLKFRQHAVVIKADIAKMYRQIEVVPEQRNFQRILYRESPHEPIKVFQLNTVTYGTSSASFQATRCLKQLAIEFKDQLPQAAREIDRSFYVDDLLSGADSVQEATKLSSDIVSIISSAGMNLRKFNSNNLQFLSAIPAENREDLATDDTTIKALGVKWNPIRDSIEFDVKPIPISKITRRIILSDISKIYDPEGLIGPVIFKLKCLMKRTWQAKLPWDSPLPDDISTEWKSVAESITELSDIQIPRQALLTNSINIQLHGFSDASKDGYGAAIYIRCEDSFGHRSAHLLCAKSRISPSDCTVIARLELCGGVVNAVLINRVEDSLTIRINRKFCWMDSAVALHWINKQPSQLQPFVANRVAEIQKLSTGITWRHVRGKDNPSDLISRGITPRELIGNSFWFQGPEFLLDSEDNWPESIVEIDPNDADFTSEFKKIQPTTLVTQIRQNDTLEHFEKCSQLAVAVRKFSPIARFIFNTRAKRLNKNRRIGAFNSDDLHEAELAIARMHQSEHFPMEMSKLSSDQLIPSNSRMKNLDPFWDYNDRVIRVGGRLALSRHCLAEQKHPIIIPNSHLSTLIIRDAHQSSMHAGQQATLGLVMMKYWPMQAKITIRRELHKCLKCFRTRPVITQQFMGQLPAPRVTPSPPFQNTGVDYAGPLSIKLSSTRNAKHGTAYIALFVCLSTKAIHLEIVSDLSTKAFLAALDRFVSRRGLPRTIHSDNGTNFVGANNVLKDLQKFLSSHHTQKEITQHLLEQRIDWHFIPPRAPAFGGLWEAGVKSMKHHLHRSIGDTKLTFEELSTVVSKIEAILNSRPITPISNDPNDLSSLTAGHFLIGRPLISKADSNLLHTPCNRLQRWQIVTKIQQTFWDRWSRDYLNQLQVRTKNYKKEIPIEVGQLAILHREDCAPLHWPLGRIIYLQPGKDGIPRVATIKTVSGIYSRPINKLSILPTS